MYTQRRKGRETYQHPGSIKGGGGRTQDISTLDQKGGGGLEISAPWINKGGGGGGTQDINTLDQKGGGGGDSRYLYPGSKRGGGGELEISAPWIKKGGRELEISAPWIKKGGGN